MGAKLIAVRFLENSTSEQSLQLAELLMPFTRFALTTLNLRFEMFTRKDYMSGKCNEDEYYSQFVNEKVIDVIKRSVTYKYIVQARDKKDFFDVSAQQWDFATGAILCLLGKEPFKERGDYVTHNGLICIAKAAARRILAEREVKFS